MKTKLVNKDIRENYTNELLMERGLSPVELEYFLNPDGSYLQSPYGLDYINQARRMFDTMVNQTAEDTIMVVVDSDVDGFTSAAIFIQYLRKFNKEVKVIPILHSGKGHGLSDTYEKISGQIEDGENVKFVVLPDAGSNDFEYIEKLGNNYGINCLILDHHIVEPDTHFSDYAVIVNNQLSPNYVNKELCGAGVTWQFCRWCDILYHTNYADEFIDLAALGLN